jgi:hypothetical protein
MDALSQLVDALLLAHYDTAAVVGDEVHVKAHGRNYSVTHSDGRFYVTQLKATTVARACADEDGVVVELGNSHRLD